MSDWEHIRKPALMKRLIVLPREEKINLIKRARVYRSGTDSCNSVYMGSLAISMLFRALGGFYGNDDLDYLLSKASDYNLNTALNVCASYIDTMEKHPTKPCRCCGQIVPDNGEPEQKAEDATGKCGELVTIGYAHRGTIGLLMENAVSKAVIVPKAGGDFKTPVMMVEQAVELLAANDQQLAELHNIFDELQQSVAVGERVTIVQRALIWKGWNASKPEQHRKVQEA